MSVKNFDVAVIIINYNSSHHTSACVRSLYAHVDRTLRFQIIVVDNNSSDDDFLKLTASLHEFPDVNLVRSKVNVGFASGNMVGVNYTDADYLFFLNNDTELQNDCLTLLHQFMKEHQHVGVCTGQMYNSDMTPHHSFSYFSTLTLCLLGYSTLRLFNPQGYPKKKVIPTTPLRVDFVTGAALFVEYKKFASVGGFDTNLFLYCEEDDLAMKFKRAGYSAYVVPEAKFIHHMGRSTTRNFAIEREYFISLFYYHRKYSGWLSVYALRLFYFWKMAKKMYKGRIYLRLAFFVLSGASMKYSLRHSQQLHE